MEKQLLVGLVLCALLTGCGGGGGGSSSNPDPQVGSSPSSASMSSVNASVTSSQVLSSLVSSSSLSSVNTSSTQSIASSVSSVFADFYVKSGDILQLTTGENVANYQSITSPASGSGWASLTGSATIATDITYISWTCSGCDSTLKYTVDTPSGNMTLTAPSTNGQPYKLLTFTLRYFSQDKSIDVSRDIIVKVDYKNVPPVAVAPSIVEASGGQSVILVGTKSFDLDRQKLIYSWQQLSGGLVSLSDPTASTTTFTSGSTSADVLKFQLTVTDTEGASSSTIETVVINPVSAPKLLLEFPKSGIFFAGEKAFKAVGTVTSSSASISGLTCDCGNGVVSIPVANDGSFSLSGINVSATQVTDLKFVAVDSNNIQAIKVVHLDPNFQFLVSSARWRSILNMVYNDKNDSLYLLSSVSSSLSVGDSAVVKVDLQTGERTDVSLFENSKQGVAPLVSNGLASDFDHNVLYLTSSASNSTYAEANIIAINTLTGSRNLISSARTDGSITPVGTGESMKYPFSITYSKTRNVLYVADRNANAVFQIDPVNGNRTKLLSGSNEAGVLSLVLDDQEKTLFLANSSFAMYSYDLTGNTGTSTKISGWNYGSGYNTTWADVYQTYQYDNVKKQPILALKNNLFYIDPILNNRSTIIDFSKWASDAIYHRASGYLYISDSVQDATYNPIKGMSVVDIDSGAKIIMAR